MNREVKWLGAPAGADSVWAYDAVFLWNNSAKRWDREFGNMYQSYRFGVEACYMGTPDGFPFWNDNAPPYRVWVRWSWENSSWKQQQTESNWKAGPHTCYGG